MKALSKLIPVALAVAAGCGAASAVPAYPGIITVKQPDNTEVSLRLKGDENSNWAETPDGYTLLQDADNYYTFARQDADGFLRASDLRYDGNSLKARLAGITPGLKFSAKQAQDMRKMQKVSSEGLQVNNSFPTLGKHKLLMVLVNYSDTEPIFSQEDFNAFMNEPGYKGIGSFRDFYLEASYGKLDIETTVTRWVTLPYAKSYYGPEGAPSMIAAALQLLDDEIDFSDFDNDGDGVLDGLAVIHQGTGREVSGDANDIWSHSSSVNGYEFDGIRVDTYTIQPELLRNNIMSNIGVMTHEFGHNLGAPDFYDTDYASSGGEFCGTGVWDLMGSGAWNGNYGDRPAGINMWQKIMFGWVEPTVLMGSARVESVPAASEQPVAYVMNTTVPGEYFVLENRQQKGVFDVSLPGHGLVIYHADEALVKSNVMSNTLNVTYPQAMYTVCADAGKDPSSETSSYGALESGAAPFPGTAGKTSFGDNTLPSSKSNSGRYSYVLLENIVENSDGTVSFDFVKGDAPVQPQDLRAEVQKGVVTLSWSLPDDAVDVDYFTIYRDGIAIVKQDGMTYVDTNAKGGQLIRYYVDVTYTNGLVSPYSETMVRVPENKVKTVNASQNGGCVVLNFGLNTTLTRLGSENMSDMTMYSVGYGEFELAHRFTADDLLTYTGGKITHVNFLSYLPPSMISYTVIIYEADADGSGMRAVTEQNVTEFGTLRWRNQRLVTPVEILPGKEYLVGVRCKYEGNIEFFTDQSGLVSGYGNLVREVGGEWRAADDAAGSFAFTCTVSYPSNTEAAALPDFGDEVNPEIDAFYPIGFRIYRDGEAIGESGNNCFVDRNAPEGSHTYTVSSLYKGGNESSGVNIVYEVFGGVDGIAGDEVRVLPVEGGISIVDYTGKVSVCDLSGRVVCTAYSDGRCFLPLASGGVYFVTVEKRGIPVAYKILK